MKNELVENRQIRIFISSTFRDMMPERDYLITKVFPKLRKYCEERDVTFFELDLRWGISEEESKQGKVVDICLHEIENTTPFFIGLLGERYGWIPTAEELAGSQTYDNYSWIKNDIDAGLSITEIEMQYGVLRSPENINAYFYFRSSEMPTPNDDDHREKQDSLEAKKLIRLKNKISAQKKYPVQNYSSIEDLGNCVEADFKALVDTLFPQGVLSELEKERLQQKAFLKSRTKTYIAVQENYDALNSFIRSDAPALVVTGDSGMGKSALIASWIEKYVKQLPLKLLYHFTGYSTSEGDYRKITQRLINEIKSLYGLADDEGEIQLLRNNYRKDNNSDKQKEELEKLLAQIATKEPLLIVLEGINQLAEIDNAKRMNWLPAFPKNVKVIYSTLTNDATMDAFRQREYEIYTVEPLTQEKRKQLITEYLKTYSKSLSPAQVDRIVSDKESENTLVLLTLLDELRVFGKHEQLDAEINKYLAAPGIHAFFDLVLERLETVYNYNETNFVRDVFSLLAVSRAGLLESEILEITTAPPLYWSQLYAAISSHLIVKNGLITFSHQFLWNAVEKRYLSNEEYKNSCRERIVAYCEEQTPTYRIYDEYPYQLYELQSIDKLLFGFLFDSEIQTLNKLYHFLLDYGVFEYIYHKNQYELGKYWRTLHEKDAKNYSVREYLNLNVTGVDKKNLSCLYNDIGFFIYHVFANYSLAMEHFQKALSIQEKTFENDHQDIATSYNNIGSVYESQGNYPQALKYYQKVLNIQGKKDIAQSYNNIGNIYFDQGNYSQALEYYQKALSIRKKVFGKEHQDVAQSYNNIGNIYSVQDDFLKYYPRALKYYQKALDIRKKVFGNEHPYVAQSYNNIGSIYSLTGDFRAEEYCHKALSIQEKTFGKEHPYVAMSYGGIGYEYKIQGDYPQALKHYQKALNIFRKIFGEEHPNVAGSYNSIGSIYAIQGDYSQALEYYQKALNIWKKALGSKHPNVTLLYLNIGSVYENMDDYPQALEYCQKALIIQRKTFGKEDTEIKQVCRKLRKLIKEGKVSQTFQTDKESDFPF